MNGLYIYGIAGRTIRTRTKGVFGRPLRTIGAGRLHVIVESAARPPKPTASTLGAQGRVLASLVEERVDLLPARFGSFVADRSELTRAMAGRDSELQRALARIRGSVQMTLRVHVASPAKARARSRMTTGTSYLRTRAAAQSSRRSHPALRVIQRAAARYARASQVEWHDSPAHLRIHHLVPRARVEAYTKAMIRALARLEAPAVLTGPWAPFAFVEIT